MLEEVFSHAFFSFQHADVTMLDGHVVKSQRRLDAKTDKSLATLNAIARSCRFGRSFAVSVIQSLTTHYTTHSRKWEEHGWHRRTHKSFDIELACKKPDAPTDADTPEEKAAKYLGRLMVRRLNFANCGFRDSAVFAQPDLRCGVALVTLVHLKNAVRTHAAWKAAWGDKNLKPSEIVLQPLLPPNWVRTVYAGLAQAEEHSVPNPEVAGSTPASGDQQSFLQRTNAPLFALVDSLQLAMIKSPELAFHFAYNLARPHGVVRCEHGAQNSLNFYEYQHRHIIPPTGSNWTKFHSLGLPDCGDHIWDDGILYCRGTRR